MRIHRTWDSWLEYVVVTITEKTSWKIRCRPRGVIKVRDKQLIGAILIEIKKVSNLYFPDVWVCINCFLCEQEIFPFLQVGCIWWRTPRHVGYVSWQQTICTPRWFFVSLLWKKNNDRGMFFCGTTLDLFLVEVGIIPPAILAQAWCQWAWGF